MNKRFIRKWLEVHKEKSHLFMLVGLLILGLAGLCTEFISSGKTINPPAINSENLSPDTIIPKGFVLVPIELANAEALSSMIDDFAIVDLYTSPLPGKTKGIRVGHLLRLIRAPLNPKTLAVLVPDDEAQSIVNVTTPLVAVVQNRKLNGMGNLDKKVSKVSRTQYYSGGL